MKLFSKATAALVLLTLGLWAGGAQAQGSCAQRGDLDQRYCDEDGDLDNQKKVFIEHFFPTVQWVMAGNDTEGLRYAAIQTPEKHWLTWKEPGDIDNPLDRALVQLCGKARFLALIHDFIVFDAGVKKLCRPNQYFGVRAAQAHVKRREGGIVWHTQGSGKSLTGAHVM